MAEEVLAAHDTVLGEYLSDLQEIADAEKADIRTYHVHLPKLVEHSYVDWDRETNVVTKGARFDDIRPLIGFVDGRLGEQPADVETVAAQD